ncbi:MAG: efflux RND transporter periplasmic adaptor subunit [Xanthomonadaceae bacterium]|nr:efflux RND transporter periplasmic adaptor subunit [Xanthomonadaceae bacterium]
MVRAAGLALAATLLLAGCGDRGIPRQSGGDAVPVTTQVLRFSDWNDSLQAIGTARARESVALTASVSEIVDQVHFDSGDQVKAGQVLVTLRGAGQRAALAEAEATYAEADQLYRRQQQLAAQQLVSRAMLDTQKAMRDAALARVQRMRADIRDRNIRAPFAGVLGIRQISPGALITSNTVIATLDDISHVYVDFPVPEVQLASLHQGDEVRARASAYPERDFVGRVSAIDARIDPATRALTVRADFDNAGRMLRPGMLLDVRLYRPTRQALALAEIAVVQVGRESFVYRVSADDSVERVDIEVGPRSDGRVEILSGLNAGDRVVVDGTGKLRAGLKVSYPADAAPASPVAPAARVHTGADATPG